MPPYPSPPRSTDSDPSVTDTAESDGFLGNSTLPVPLWDLERQVNLFSSSLPNVDRQAIESFLLCTLDTQDFTTAFKTPHPWTGTNEPDEDLADVISALDNVSLPLKVEHHSLAEIIDIHGTMLEHLLEPYISPDLSLRRTHIGIILDHHHTTLRTILSPNADLDKALDELAAGCS